MALDICRHRDLFDPYKFKEQVHIIGAGATGSWLVMALAKLGIENITVHDFDKIEEHNIPNQCFGLADIGEMKSITIANKAHADTSIEVDSTMEAITGKSKLSGIVFMMVDTMSARKEIWEGAIKYHPGVKLLVEPRMGLNSSRIYNVDPMNLEHIKRYETEFYTDEEAQVSACGSSQSVISSSLSVAGMCVRQLINYYNGEEIDNEILHDYVYNNLITTRW